MKKLFSIVLVAAGMFMSANAGVVTDPAQLQAALNAGGTVQLGGGAEDFVIADPIKINLDGEVILDLNGHNLVYVEDWKTAHNTKAVKRGHMIDLTKGTVKVINSVPATGGQILNNTEAAKNYSTGYYNGTKATLTADHEIVVFSVVGSAEEINSVYTKLEISSEVTVKTPQGKVGIIVNVAQKDNYATYNYIDSVAAPKATSVTLSYGRSYGVVIDVYGTVHGEKYGIQVSGNVSAAPGMVFPVTEFDWNTLPSYKDLATAKAAYTSGRLNYNGKWQSSVYTQGYTISKDLAFPKINIMSTADVSANPTVMENGNGLYCGGFAKVTINGYVHGSNGVYIKAGDITIKDAVIVSENETFTPTEGKRSGTEGSGNAIVIESNAGYPGGSTVTISGDSKIEAAGGYAIQETITTAGESKVDGVTIEGGTFKGGTQGGMIYSEETKSDGSVVITDGNMQNFKPGETEGLLSGDNFIVTTEDGTIVVCSGSAPSWKTDDLANDNGDYQWTTAKTQNIESDINVGFFDMEKGAVNVKAGKTMTVNRLVMGPTAKIVVEVGGRLIVDGNLGIVANDAENITIQAQENNMGQFLFNPAVNSNRHPKATVTFNSKAWGKTDLVQFFGCPMQSVDSIVINNNVNNNKAQFDIWRNGAWDRVGVLNGSGLNYDKFNLPFAVASIMSNNDKDHLLSYNFYGELLGNTQPEGFKIVYGWTNAANSWTGDADPGAMIEELDNLDCVAAVYTYSQSIGGNIVWNARDVSDPVDKIEPMQPLLFCNENNRVIAHDIMNYENLVWNFRNGASAPARATDFTKAAIRIANANGLTDRAVVSEHAAHNCAPKYPNEAIRVYVSADQEYDIFATNNVENTYVGFNCVEAGTYTVSFDGIQGDNLVLVDLVNNREIAIVEGAEYQFEAQANTINPAHFQVRKVAEVATNVENAAVQNDVIKTIVNDQVVIIRNGVRYNTVGQRL